MHALEIINDRNAKAAGITVQQNRAEALAGQYIRRPSSEIHEKAPGSDAVKLTVDSSPLSPQQESSQ